MPRSTAGHLNRLARSLSREVDREVHGVRLEELPLGIVMPDLDLPTAGGVWIRIVADVDQETVILAGGRVERAYVRHELWAVLGRIATGDDQLPVLLDFRRGRHEGVLGSRARGHHQAGQC